LRLIYTNYGALALNVLGMELTGAVTFNQALSETVGVAVKNAWVTFMSPRVGIAMGLVRVGVRDLRSANLPEFLDTGPTVVGVGTGDPLPLQTAAVATIRTAKAGKKFTGRVYFPGFLETDNVGAGEANAAVSTAITGFLGAVDSALGNSGMHLGVISRPSERIVVTKVTYHADGTTETKTLSDQSARAGQVTDAVAFESRTNLWETQRRRSNGRGVVGTLFGPVARTASTR
jgi:hypothetical protein